MQSLTCWALLTRCKTGKGLLFWQAGGPDLHVNEVDEEMLERPNIDHVWTIKVRTPLRDWPVACVMHVGCVRLPWEGLKRRFRVMLSARAAEPPLFSQASSRFKLIRI